MKISILKDNVMGEHPSITAWRLSRPDSDVFSKEEIISLDLPVNEIPVVTLFIESTILEREIIFSLRSVSAWAQTSRVQNILKFEYPDELSKHKGFFIDQKLKMCAEDNIGIRQDSYRRHLPIMSITKYTVNISMRDLIHLYKFFLEMSCNDSYKHLRDLFLETCSKLFFVLSSTFSIGKFEINKYRTRSILNSIEISNSGLIGDTLVVNIKSLSISLRAQLARHRALHLQDNLLHLMKSKSIITETNEMNLEVQVSGLVSDWIGIVRKRSCWLAQYDLWKDLLDKVEEFIGLGEDGLPCHNGICPYSADAIMRYTNRDPNAVCPKFANLNNKPVNNDQLSDICEQFKQDKRPDFWISEIKKLESK